MTTEFYNLEYLNQCIADFELSEIMQDIMDKDYMNDPTYSQDEPGIAQIFYNYYGDKYCYCPDTKTWYEWDINRWTSLSSGGQVLARLNQFTNLLIHYAREKAYRAKKNNAENADEVQKRCEKYLKILGRMRSGTRLKSLLTCVEMNQEVTRDRFDLHPNILNTPRGAFDLTKGAYIDDEDRRYLNPTKLTEAVIEFNPGYGRWGSFIDEIMDGNKEKAAFLQRAFGYSILGSNEQECMFVMHGKRGRNGKTTMVNTILAALGRDYAGTGDVTLLCERRNKTMDVNQPQPGLSSISGLRLVNFSELPRGARLDSAVVKALTGRTRMKTRDLYSKTYDFIPEFTMWLDTNYLPDVTDSTIFGTDRIWVIEFEHYFDENERDTGLKNELLYHNLDYVMKWLIDGCNMYRKMGLAIPDIVREDTQRYANSQDRVGEFIKECCEVGKDFWVKRSELHLAYQDWCAAEERKYVALSPQKLAQELDAKGIGIRKRGGFEGYLSIQLSKQKCLQS